jgi:hypothetical protein
MLDNLTTIKGKNNEVRQGILKWIDVPNSHIGEFWFYDGITPLGMWGKLDYWEFIGNGVKIFKISVK